MKAGWPLIALAELTKHRPICYGVLKPGERQAEGVPLLRITDIKENFLDTSDIYQITEELSSEFKRSVLRGGEVLLSIQGTIGRAAICPPEFAGSNISRTIALIDPDSRMENQFLRYCLLNMDGTFPTGGATRASLNISDIRDLRVPLPPLEEQRRIVAILDEAFEGLSRARANAEANLQSARELFDASVFEVLEEVRSDAPDVALEHLTSKITKGSSPKWQGISYVDEPGVLFVTSENVGKNEIDLSKPKYVEAAFNEKDRKSILQFGDVLTNIVGASIGRTAVFDRNDSANINQAVCLIRCDASKLENYYLAYLLNSPHFKAMLHEGEVNMARANLSLSFFRGLKIPAPIVDVQQQAVLRISQVRGETDRLAAAYVQSIADVDNLRQSLLQKAFAGELTARELA